MGGGRRYLLQRGFTFNSPRDDRFCFACLLCVPPPEVVMQRKTKTKKTKSLHEYMSQIKSKHFSIYFSVLPFQPLSVIFLHPNRRKTLSCLCYCCCALVLLVLFGCCVFCNDDNTFLLLLPRPVLIVPPHMFSTVTVCVTGPDVSPRVRT